MRLLTALSLFLFPVQAQQLPDAESLMKQVGEVYQSFTTLKYETETIMQQPGEGTPRRTPTKTMGWCVIARPGKRHQETFSPRGNLINISDGRTHWLYDPMRKEYTKSGVAPDRPAVASAEPPDKPRSHISQRTLRGESIEIDGQKYDCWVVETRTNDILPTGTTTADPASQTTEVSITHWIDKTLLFERQSIQLTKIQRAGSVMQFLVTSVSKNFRINEPIADSTFMFVPPPDAKEVERIGIQPTPTVDLVGKEAPDFRVKDIDAKVYSLASLKGKPVLLDFWATWCEPCRESMPVLESVYAEYKDQGLVILGVNSREDLKTVKAFLNHTPFAYPTALSGDSGICEAYRVGAIPTFVLIGRDGRIAAQRVGLSGEGEIRLMLEKVGLKAAAKAR